MTPDPATAPRARKERKANADKRRQQLLDATLRSIATNGLARTTLATVAAEAGLSQGVAVFYFKTKTGLLTEALREHYSRYRQNWTGALEAAGSDPVEQLVALIRADFAPAICNAEALSIWFAFWGEQKFTPQYAEISAQFDEQRAGAIETVCGALLPDRPAAEARRIADWIDTLTDGYWQRLHVVPGQISPGDAMRAALDMVAHLLADHRAAILSLTGAQPSEKSGSSA